MFPIETPDRCTLTSTHQPSNSQRPRQGARRACVLGSKPGSIDPSLATKSNIATAVATRFSCTKDFAESKSLAPLHRLSKRSSRANELQPGPLNRVLDTRLREVKDLLVIRRATGTMQCRQACPRRQRQKESHSINQGSQNRRSEQSQTLRQRMSGRSLL